MTTFKIEPQEAAMDKERVLDLLGAQFRGKYAAGAAEWLKNSYDQAVRTDEPGKPVIIFRLHAPKARNGSDGVMECVDFLGACLLTARNSLRPPR